VTQEGTGLQHGQFRIRGGARSRAQDGDIVALARSHFRLEQAGLGLGLFLGFNPQILVGGQAGIEAGRVIAGGVGDGFAQALEGEGKRPLANAGELDACGLWCGMVVHEGA